MSESLGVFFHETETRNNLSWGKILIILNTRHTDQDEILSQFIPSETRPRQVPELCQYLDKSPKWSKFRYIFTPHLSTHETLSFHSKHRICNNNHYTSSISVAARSRWKKCFFRCGEYRDKMWTLRLGSISFVRCGNFSDVYLYVSC